MTLALDGYSVFSRIGKHSEAFADIKAEVSKAAQTLVLKQLTAKKADIGSLRAVRRALDEDAFSLIVDALPDAKTKTLVGKFDKENKDIKTASAQARRQHLCDLADGSTAPKPKAARKATSRSKNAAKKEPERLQSEAMRARRRSD